MKMSSLSSANFTEGNILLKERTQMINNKIKLLGLVTIKIILTVNLVKIND